ncbi:MAG: DNA-directed RNA polymerase subunit K [Candidatus Thorarchaeota archaeon]|nr:DNA-directed RNA polymerase subunit K [Candidatus Thorarchaeota archaeon]
MSDAPDPSDFVEDEEPERKPVTALTRIPNVGQKTAEKLAAAGYDTVAKVAEADAAVLAETVSGLSQAKAEGMISAAKALLDEKVSDEPSDKKKKKKSSEAEPERVKLPPLEVVRRVEEKVSVESGIETDNKAMGVPIGPKWLTKYEKARVIGARALQVSMGAPTLIPMEGKTRELFGFAEAEMKAGVLPMTVRRTLPTGEYADIPLSILLKNTKLG